MIFCEHVTLSIIHAGGFSKLDFVLQESEMAAIFLEKQRKILKIHSFWRKNQQILKLKFGFYAVYIKSYLSEENRFK